MADRFGASLYFHHSWDNWQQQAMQPFSNIRSHVLLEEATELGNVSDMFLPLLKPEVIQTIVNSVPGEWLTENGSAEEMREVYVSFLNQRIRNFEIFINEAWHARSTSF